MTQDLQTQLSDFEQVVALQLTQNVALTSVARVLRELYAVKIANAVISSVAALYPSEVENSRQLSAEEDQSKLQIPSLPSAATVRSAISRLSEAITLNDGRGAIVALREMRAFALCPSTDVLFNRLEFSVGCVVGPACLIPLVELALMAGELSVYKRAASYLVKAHALDPGAPELHDINTVAGLIALNSGNVTEAKERLLESVRVCDKNEFAWLACNIRAFNLLLAEKLLERGEDAAVIQYLSRCQAIWEYETKRIALWIEAIRNGKEPAFQIPSFLNRPALKIQALAIRSSFLPAQHETSFETSRLDIRAAREQMLAEYKREMAAAIKGKLERGRN